MPSYTLEIQAFGVYTTNIPSLEIWADGALNSTHTVSSSGSTISVTISYGGALPTSLAFTFNDGFAANGRTIEIQSVKINDRYVNTGNFLSADSLSKSATATVNVTNSDFIFNQSADPASSEFTTGATQTFTGGIDFYNAYGGSTAQVFDLLGGGDYAHLGSGNDKVSGGAGDDVLRGNGGNDLLFGDTGNDRLVGGAGTDTLHGGDGDDRLYGNAGNDELHGGAGDDRLVGGGDDDILTGGTGDDLLTGGSGADYLFGDADNDQLVGGAGDDTIDGGDGNDLVYGGAGADAIEGGDGNDILIGNQGNDVIHGNDGDDEIYGQADDDTLFGGAGGDLIMGGTGNNTLYGDGGFDFIFSEGGTDTLYGGAGTDALNSGAGDDTLYGGDDDDVLTGGAGADTLYGDNGNDVLHGHGISYAEIETIQNADFTLVYNDYTNSFYRHANVNTQWADAVTNSAAYVVNGIGGHIATVTTSVENYYMQQLLDPGVDAWLSGSGTGQGGMWTWNGGAEDGLQFSLDSTAVNNMFEFWAVGEPNDTTDNVVYTRMIQTDATWADNTGTDTLHYITEWDAGLMNDDNAADILYGGAGDDWLYGYGGDDTLNGEEDNDILIGGAGDDELNGGNGADVLYGGDDDDTLNGGGGADTLYGGDGTDTLNGGTGVDTIYGGNDVDIVNGGTGGDTLYGGNAGDTIDGGIGDDTIYGDGAIFVDDFEDADASDWVGGTSETDGFFGSILGRFTMGGTTQQVSKTISITDTSSPIVIEFDMLEIDSWDAENARIFIDDTELAVMNWQHTNADEDYSGSTTINGMSISYTVTATGDGTTNSTYSGWSEQVHKVQINITNPNSTVELGFGAQLNSGVGDESLGIDNIIVYSTGGGDDNITGGDGDDTIYGGIGNDVIDGGDGDDTIYSSNEVTTGTDIIADILAANAGVVYNESTGNFYQFVAGDGATNFTWAQANTAATGSTLNGAAGHLITITSADEHNTADTILVDTSGTVADVAWTGGADTGTEGVYQWVTGPESGTVFWNGGSTGEYTNWYTGTPQNNTGTNDHMLLLYDAFSSEWYMFDGTAVIGAANPSGYIVEWEGDVVLGTAGTASLSGGDGLDTLYGTDSLTDTFVFESASAFNDIDVIENFTAADGDAIDISDLLTGYVAGTSDINDFIQFTNSGANSLVQVDTNGATGGASFTTIAQINGINDLDASALLYNNSIVA